jgi:SAM-dependent methyltransferase
MVENMSSPQEHNRRAWDGMVRDKQRFTIPARDEDFLHPLKTVDQLGWLGGDIRGRKLLCLAAGGGKHGPLYAAAGAEVTVVDISPAMLELDREVAAERGYALRTVEASMDDLAAFAPGEFDIVIHPVSTCYVPEIAPVYREVARITRSGGLYISQHKTPTNLQAEQKPTARGYEVSEPYYRTGPLPPVVGSRLREEGTLEYLHRWEGILGHLCRSGFVIEDVCEPLHADKDAEPGSFGHRCKFIAPYVRIKARRTGTAASGGAKRLILSE